MKHKSLLVEFDGNRAGYIGVVFWSNDKSDFRIGWINKFNLTQEDISSCDDVDVTIRVVQL